MREDMLLSGLSQKTQKFYIYGVLKLARYYHRSPSDLSEEEVRNFIIFLKDESGLSADTVRVSFFGLKFLYQKTLGRNWKIFDIIRIPKPNHLPVVLSFEEVKKILPHISHPKYKMILTLIYSCGLRLSECLSLKTEDIRFGGRPVVRPPVPGFSKSKSICNFPFGRAIIKTRYSNEY